MTVTGAVSPPGGDFSEPVTQNTLRIVYAVYALDAQLANQRHFPAISWLTSYSLYADSVAECWNDIVPGWSETRTAALKMLQLEAELEEIVRLVGPEALPEKDKLLLLVSKMLREDFLMQNAYHEIDTYTTPERAQLVVQTIMKFNDLAQKALADGGNVAEFRASPVVRKISRIKDIPNETVEQSIKELWAEMEISLVAQKGGVA